jgi:hypothetical protein
MNFFERELRKLFENSEALSNTRFTGRVCLARLTDTTNVKLEFVTLGHHERYEGIKATVLNRSEGQIDSTVFRFDDILGSKSMPGGHKYPHVWKTGDNYEWYSYKPTPRDVEMLTDTVDSYLEVFQDLAHDHDMSQQMC